MTQEYIVYLIVAITFAYVLYKLVGQINIKKESSCNSNSCGDCTGCDGIKEFNEKFSKEN